MNGVIQTVGNCEIESGIAGEVSRSDSRGTRAAGEIGTLLETPVALAPQDRNRIARGGCRSQINNAISVEVSRGYRSNLIQRGEIHMVRKTTVKAVNHDGYAGSAAVRCHY